jgi:hypothetical protein
MSVSTTQRLPRQDSQSESGGRRARPPRSKAERRRLKVGPKIGSMTIFTAACTRRSRTAGIDNGRLSPNRASEQNPTRREHAITAGPQVRLELVEQPRGWTVALRSADARAAAPPRRSDDERCGPAAPDWPKPPRLGGVRTTWRRPGAGPVPALNAPAGCEAGAGSETRAGLDQTNRAESPRGAAPTIGKATCPLAGLARVVSVSIALSVLTPAPGTATRSHAVLAPAPTPEPAACAGPCAALPARPLRQSRSSRAMRLF